MYVIFGYLFSCGVDICCQEFTLADLFHIPLGRVVHSVNPEIFTKRPNVNRYVKLLGSIVVDIIDVLQVVDRPLIQTFLYGYYGGFGERDFLKFRKTYSEGHCTKHCTTISCGC